MDDLSAVAAANGPARRAQARAAIDADETGTLGRFHAFVGASAFSTNAYADKVIAFDGTGEVLDARRVRIHQAGGDERAGLAAFEHSQGALSGRREGFEDLWTDGRRFVYGAVNAGGLGADLYGSFCLVVDDPTRPPPDALGVFPGDSVARYTGADGAVDRAKAAHEATAWDQRSDLGVIECGSRAVAESEQAWASVVCRRANYLEVSRSGPLGLGALDRVRLAREYRRRLDLFVARELLQEELTGPERNEVAAYTAVRRWRDDHDVSVDEVPNEGSG